MTIKFTDKIHLNNNQKIPIMGFGTAELEGDTAEKSVLEALRIGYRLIDTSPNYQNETDVGNAIQEALDSFLSRDDLYLVTKIEPEDMSLNNVEQSLMRSLNRLNLEYVDLLIIHAPSDSASINLETWKGLENVYETGKTKGIGVSNFNSEQLEFLVENGEIKPAINQIEFRPGKLNNEIVKTCKNHGICVMSYSPIKELKQDSKKSLEQLSVKYDKSPEQIVLRWAIEKNTIPIPRSQNKKHIKENTEIFEFSLTTDEIKLIDEMT
jgi:diketogulonate reductase-like aldo/keto reductase